MTGSAEKLQHELQAAQHTIAELQAKLENRETGQRLVTLELEENRSALLFMLEDLEAGRNKVEHAHQEWMAALDVVEDPIFLHDKQFRILRCNKAYQQCAGIPFDDLIGQPYYEVFPKTGTPLPCCLRALKKAEEEEEEVTVGGAIYRSRAFAIKDEQGAYLYSVHTLEDITESRRAKAALIESEEKFRKITESAQDAIIMMGADQCISFWNAAAERIFGYNAEEALGQELHALIVPEPAHTRFTQAFPHFQATGEGPFIDKITEVSALRKGGEEFPVELSISATQLNGQWHAISTVRDITQRRQAEESLKNMAAKYHTMFELSSDAIMLLDEKGFFDCNPATLRMFSCPTRGDFISKHPAEFSPPTQPGGEDSMSLANQRIATALKNGNNLFEWMHRRLDGTDFPAEVLLTALKLDGKPVLQATVRDITERKQVEAAIQHANRALAALSAVNKSLVRAGSEDELLQSICQTIVKQRGYLLAWVGYKQHDEGKSIKIMSYASGGEGYPDTMQPTWAEEARGMGPSGRAVRSSATQLCQDIANDPHYSPWRDKALQRGYAASIALPLLLNGGNMAFGVLAVYAGEVNAFTPAEIALLEEMAGDMAFGVHTLHTRHERDLAQDKVQQQLVQLQDSLENTVRAIATIVEMRDPYTAGHQIRVADLAAAIARQMGLPEEQIHAIHLAGIVHDLGKIRIPAEILSKPGRITDLEFELIKVHPQAGYDILKGISFPWPIALMVLQHHERLDGSGYPQGLRGDAILLEARILSVADVVEAIYSHRPYRPGLGIEVAMEEITKQRGTHYDPQVVDACVAVFREQGYSFK